MLDEVNEQHPGRTFLLIADRETDRSGLEAYVSTRCRILHGSGKEVCGEQVTVEAKGPAVGTAATAIAPLLVPDVPVFLWWKDVPDYQDKLWQQLVATSDRVVVDSACFDKPYEDLKSLALLLKDKGDDVRLSDLNWGRLTTWRTLVASFWDVPAYRSALDEIDTISIVFCRRENASEDLTPKALLLVGWLSSRLGWHVAGFKREGDRAVFTFNTVRRQISVSLREVNTADSGNDELYDVKLAASNGSAQFSIACSRDRRRLSTEARIEGEVMAGRTLAYESRTEGQRLSNELSFLSRDQVFEDCISSVEQLIEAVIATER
jgi:glucose-6-phosphate dehydrogenase assembly protein OpcA